MDDATKARALADAAYDAWHDAAHRKDLHERVRIGADGTPTSRADDLLDHAILAVAQELELAVLSEESGLTGTGTATAVVDPLDGSRNASRGLPFYCVSIAIGDKSMSDLKSCCIRDLVTGTRYEAVAGGGATVDGGPVPRRTFDADELLVAMIADYEDPKTLDRLQRKGHHARDLGSAALELCYVGTGALDVFEVRRKWLRVIDIAGGALFVREAGGCVVDPDTLEDLDMPFDLRARAALIAATDRRALEALA